MFDRYGDFSGLNLVCKTLKIFFFFFYLWAERDAKFEDSTFFRSKEKEDSYSKTTLDPITTKNREKGFNEKQIGPCLCNFQSG